MGAEERLVLFVTSGDPEVLLVGLDNVDECDRCGAIAPLFHNELAGLAFCEDCDMLVEEFAVLLGVDG